MCRVRRQTLLTHDSVSNPASFVGTNPFPGISRDRTLERKCNAAFTPAQLVARNTQLVAGNKQLAARNMMLVARNKLRVARNTQLDARNKHQVARSLLRATFCAGVNAA